MNKSDYCSKLEIKGNTENPAVTELYIDGHKISGVRSMTFTKKAGTPPTLTMDLNAFDISIDSPALLMQKGIDETMKITFAE